MLTDARKLFSITTTYDPNFLFPGSTLPGPEAPRLTAPKEFDGKTWAEGDFDPEWKKPDTENIYLGEFDGRFYYSIRADISTELDTLGEIGDEVDPQTHADVPAELYDTLHNSAFISHVLKEEGVTTTADQRFNAMFPNMGSLKSAVVDHPEIIAQFLETEEATSATVMAKLGVVKSK